MKNPTHNIEITLSRNNVVPGGVAVWIHELRRLCMATAILDGIILELDCGKDCMWQPAYDDGIAQLKDAVFEKLEARVREQYQTDTAPDVDEPIGGAA